MSFLKRLFSKKAEGGRPAPKGLDLRQLPRLHPYRFAHTALPSLVFENSAAFVDSLDPVLRGGVRMEPVFDMMGQLLVYRPVFNLLRAADPEFFEDREK